MAQLYKILRAQRADGIAYGMADNDLVIPEELLKDGTVTVVFERLTEAEAQAWGAARTISAMLSGCGDADCINCPKRTAEENAAKRREFQAAIDADRQAEGMPNAALDNDGFDPNLADELRLILTDAGL